MSQNEITMYSNGSIMNEKSSPSICTETILTSGPVASLQIRPVTAVVAKAEDTIDATDSQPEISPSPSSAGAVILTIAEAEPTAVISSLKREASSSSSKPPSQYLVLPPQTSSSSFTSLQVATTTNTNESNINTSKNTPDDNIELLAPENFAVVEGGVYRSSFPRSKNIQFLKKLKLKSVISLVPEDYPQVMLEFYHSQGTKLLAHGLEGNKWPFKGIDFAYLQYTLHDILNPNNRPLLIHCNKGKHRTGSVVGCLRKIRNWALSAIFAEYLLYASPKTRLEDQMLIESFEYDPNFRLDEESEKKLFKEMKKKAKLKKDDDEDDEGSDGEDKKEKKKDKEKKNQDKKDKEKDKDKTKETKEKDDKPKEKDQILDQNGTDQDKCAENGNSHQDEVAGLDLHNPSESSK